MISGITTSENIITTPLTVHPLAAPLLELRRRPVRFLP